ncbi:MAG: hypothetical protein HY870_13570 [Chloroflexi bacterium]|nr:hypothetical protein [Chloroflexota bacterium]
MDTTKGLSYSRWYELKGQVRQTFAKLTADDVEQLSGGMDDLAGMVQHRYGYTRSQADIAVNNWLRSINNKAHAKA